jgi:hypothetical protein
MPDPGWWRRRDWSWWPMFFPWIGVETWEPEDAVEIGLPARGRWRLLSVEWFHRGFTLAAWEARDD